MNQNPNQQNTKEQGNSRWSIIGAMAKIPLVRIIARLLEEISKPAPLKEFADYSAYWDQRVAIGNSNQLRNRFIIITDAIKQDDRVLDIGCGDGTFLSHLSDKKPNVKSFGVDIAPTAIEQVNNRGLEGKVICPYKRLKNQIESKWTVITLMEVIEHHVDAEDLMRQVIELAPERIFVTIPNIGCLKHRLRLMIGGRFPVTSIVFHMKEHVRFWTVKDFKQWSDMLGLNINAIQGQFDSGDRFVRWFVKKWPSIFADQVVYELSLMPTESE